MKSDDERAKSRPERVPLHKQRLFEGQTRPGYVRRFVNDSPGRIDSFILAGWTIVSGDSAVTHDGLSHVESQLGSGIHRVVNKGINAESRVAYLMEIPEELYNEDQMAKQLKIDKTEEAFDQEGILRAAQMYGRVTRR